MSGLLALAAAWLTATPAGATAVQRVQIRDDALVISFDEAAARASSFLLDGPQRIAIDVVDAAPGKLGTPLRRLEPTGPIAGMRQGVRTDGARIVFDLAAPAVVTGGSFDDTGRTLTLQLKPVDPRRFAAAAAHGPLSFLSPVFGSGKKYSVTVPVPPPLARKGVVLPRVYGKDDSRPLVVIDAGHGGHDPGAISPTSRLREKDVTLAVAKAIRDDLVASGRVRVALTREDDRFLVLQERFGIARRLKADLFISIHCDSAGNTDATGASVYTLSEVASDKEAARLAARENKADILAGVNLAAASPDISSILIDLTQRETMNASANFARLLGREAKPLMPFRPNFHKMASLMVLKAPDLPSILFETGYISNDTDAEFLASREGQEKIAQGVRRAVEVHFARRMASR